MIEGFSIPGIIHNGGYYFVDMDVYADGRVECWNFEDLEHFKKDVRSGWVAVNVPENSAISIYSLGSWEIVDGAWLYNEESYIEYVLSLIRMLNPGMDNIFQYRERVVNGVRIGENGTGTNYKPVPKSPGDPFPERVTGKGLDLFYCIDQEFFLIKVIVFPDLTIRFDRLETAVDITFEDLETLVANGVIVSALPVNAKVHIYGLGHFTAKTCHYNTDIKDKLLEIRDIIRELNNEPSSLQVCIAAYEEYLKHPTDANREQLRISYELVPKHRRRYVGDMDVKDTEVRMIIYGKQEIENWSHYQAAQAMGITKPAIILPPPANKNESK